MSRAASARDDAVSPTTVLAAGSCALLLGSLAVLTGPWTLEPGTLGALALWGAGAVGALGLGALSMRRLDRARRLRDTRGFDVFFGADSTPTVLTDRTGAPLHANPAMLRFTEGAPLSDPADFLAPFSNAPDSLCYRLALGALRKGEACETDGAHRVRARRSGARRLLWTVEPMADAAAAVASTRVAEPHFASNAVVDKLPVALARLTEEGVLIYANEAARALLGPEARSGARFSALLEGLGRSIETRIAEAIRGDSSGRAEIARAEPDGREVFLQVSLTRVETRGEVGLFAVLADATELKTLEAQFVQSQKMQAVGQLAGGVAHDFNNLLTAISGHCDLLLQRHAQGDPDYPDLSQVRQNANRAAALVRQLLAFSRKQTLRPRIVNLTDALTEISHLLNRLLGEKVTLRIEHAPNLHLVKVDERQFEQVVMNLVVNARDAMKETGGEVTLRTSNRRVGSEMRIGRAVMPKGEYVQIDVIDTGVGIPAEKIDQIFEPFYTTKKTGEGTGLGLSTVYGIVKQTGGFIFAKSTPNEGSTFSIYLPRHIRTEAERASTQISRVVERDLTGSGKVLLIEDEAPVRAFAARALKLRGYEVLEAPSAEEAIEILEDDTLEIHVIVSDVVMPGMDGPTCVRKAREKRPDVSVVFVSGYAEDALKRNIDGLKNCHFLPKPFSLNELTAKVKECVED